MIQTTRRDNRSISDSVVYQSHHKPIGIGSIIVEFTRRVNDFKTVYLERKHKTYEDTTTVSFFGGEEKLQSRLRYSNVLHGSILLSPFFVPFYVLLLALLHIICGVVPFSLVVALVPTSLL